MGANWGTTFLPAYLGYSTGKWNGGHHGRRHPRLQREDMVGSDRQKPTSDALHVTERFSGGTDFGPHGNSGYNRRPEGLLPSRGRSKETGAA